MARKPLVGTVAANVLEHGTGALNVDGCRVATSDPLGGGGATTAVSDHWDRPFRHDPVAIELLKKTTAEKIAKAEQLGRWPANLIHDGSDEVVGLFPQTRSGGILPHHKRTTSKGKHNIGSGVGNGPLHAPVNGEHFPADTGSAARFFYTAKATQAERQGVTHPTVKPLDLMAYLCRLITPPGGVVLDPFMGSGTTIKAAIGEGFQAIGIERDPAYFAMAEHRMNGVQLGLALTAA
jgi:site-specific DNA-methyltransferase (adenine-specific)